MLFHRSTRSIVTGKRSKQTEGDSPEPAEAGSGEREAPRSAGCRGFLTGSLRLPVWGLWAACGVVFVLLAVILSLALAPHEKAPEAPQTQRLPAGQTVVSVPAEPGLTALAASGDIVRLCAADGSVIDELQYLQVYQTAGDSLLLLADARQAAAIVSHEISGKVVLIAHGDPDYAAELLELQERISDPQITLELTPGITLSPGENLTLELQARIQPAEATLPQIEWQSDNRNVVTVRDGTVCALGPGQATVTAVCGNTRAVCRVTVEIPLTGLTLSDDNIKLAVGESYPLAALREPENTTWTGIDWSVSDESVVTVSEGAVTAVAPGTATVTAACGGVSAECVVTVGYHAQVVQLSRQTLSLTAGQSFRLEAAVYPGDDMIDDMRYSSSNNGIATVSPDGTVTAVAPGTVTVTLRCGSVGTECTVTVTKAP